DLQRKSGDVKRLISKVGDTYCNPDDFFTGYKMILDFCQSLGFNGFVIFNDEFNRLLAKDQALSSKDLDFLQDFAEYNLRLKSTIVLHYLLLHKGISQYLNGISVDRRKEWLKIEGRFYQIHFQEELADVYGLIANYLKRNTNYKISNDKDSLILSQIKTAWKINPFLGEEIGPELKEIAHRAYPLHISNLVALPLLCNLLGQNERTLFGYLSDVPSRKKKDSMYLDDLFDYFDTSIDKLGLDDSLLTRWHYGRNALSEVTQKEKTRVIKALTILSVINRPNLLPASIRWISFSLGLEDDTVKSILKELSGENLALYREANKTYSIYYGSSIDLARKIDELLPTISIGTIARTIEDIFSLSPVYANSYNAEYFTSRFYSRKFILEENIREFIQYKADEESEPLIKNKIENTKHHLSIHLTEILEKEEKSGASGVILYFLGNPNSDIAQALRTLVGEKDKKNKILSVFSEIAFHEIPLLKKYAACVKLSEDLELIRRDPRIKNDTKIYLSDLHDKLHFTLRSLFEKSKAKLVGSYNFDESESLSQIVSGILLKRFPHCPKVNSEFINRENISPIIRNTRKKILRDMIAGDLSLGSKEKGYGPDVAIFRSLFSIKSVYKTTDGRVQYSFVSPEDYLGNHDEGLRKVFEAIHKYLQEESERTTLDRLYEILTSEPFGMYSEMIPFYFLAALLEKSYSFSLYEEDRYEKEINSDILEKLHANPKNFKIHIIRSNALLEKYLMKISELFASNDATRLVQAGEARLERKINENKIYRSVLAILYWYTKLPECTRHTKDLSNENSKFLQIISHSVNPELLLLEEIPELFGSNLESIREKDLEQFIAKLKKAKQEIESHYNQLIEKIAASTLKIIKPYITSQKSQHSLSEAISSFKMDNEYKLELLRKHDSSFQKLMERIRSNYESEFALLESLTSLLCDVHPRYWKDNTIQEYEFKLTTELAKIHVATLMSNPGESAHMKMDRILQEYRSLKKEERQMLINRLKEEV
ncbi:MAG TPA: hypothetical protein PKC66_22750, partial [Leptospiraceae bacterium]|nr:hypothetical protein [Leptospiraceae bacterium]